MAVNFNRRCLLTVVGAGGLLFGTAPHTFAQAPAPTAKPQDWVKIPAMRFPCLSPDGQRNAYIVQENGTKSLMTFDVKSGKAGRIDIGDVDVYAVRWIGNSHISVATLIPERRADVEAGPGSVILGNVYNIDSPNRITLFDAIANFKAGLISSTPYPIQRGGKWQVAVVSRHGPEEDFSYLYAIDPDTGHGEMLDRGPKETLRWVFAPDGTPVARSGYYFHDDQWAVEYYNGQAWKEIHRVNVDRMIPSLSGLGRDGKSIVISVAGDDELGSYYEVTPDGTLSAALGGNTRSEAPFFHPQTFRFIGIMRIVDGAMQYDMFDPAMAALAKKAQDAVPGYRMRLSDIAQDPNIAIVYSEGEDDAGSWYYINFGTGQTTQIGSAYPDIDPANIADKRLYKYQASDGLAIEAYLTLPVGEAPKGLPMVVMPHGDLFARDTLDADWMAEALAAAGYAVFQPNYRGSIGFGADFLAAGNGQWGRKRQTDLSDGVAKLVADGTVDAKRVCIVGDEIGGYMALAGVTLQQGIYNCAVDIGGYSDLTLMMAALGSTNTSLYRLYAHLFGDGLDAISPANLAAQVTVPVLILHSQDDSDVPYQQSSRMANALRGAGKDVTFVTTKSTDDWERTQAWRDEVMTPVLAFLAKTNPA